LTGPVLVVQHEDECPPALFGAWLTDAGVALDIRRPDLDEALPATLDVHSGMLVLGGAMNAVDEETTPWLATTKALVRSAVERDLPLLGICLGHQIVAHALGGTVAPNPRGTQADLLDIGWTTAADDDLLFRSRPRRAVHWNDDIVIRPPSGSTVLASAPGGEVQALRFARHAWGIQSHPEVDATMLRTWAEHDGVDAEEFIGRTAAAREELDTSWRPVARRFARLCGPETRR
jgi:GMP synthase (glutamine-hydrolysing)